MTDAVSHRAQVAVGPLEGYRVLDLTSVIMGPYATQMLGDLGADVIWVEEGEGDITRVMVAGSYPGLSGIALNLHRNKRNVSLDLKSDGGRDALLRIARTCDVVVTNLRPASLARLGLTYEDVTAINPNVVYCQAQGWPSDSPMANSPAYDDIIQSASGIADAFRLGQGEPRLAPTILADKICGMAVASAVTAALLHRERTGEGQRVEVPMVDVMTSFLLTEHIGAAATVPRSGPVGHLRILTPNRRPMSTADGWIGVLPYTTRHWQVMFEAGGRADLRDDSRIMSPAARFAASDFLYGTLAEILPSRSTADWLKFCEGQDIPATRVISIDDLVDDLPEAEHPVAGRYKVIPSPVRFMRTPARSRRPAPLTGEHSLEILQEAGLLPSEIRDLCETGAVKVVDT